MLRLSLVVFLMMLLVLRFSHEMPVLVIVSMLAYFCFLEQLLVRNIYTSCSLSIHDWYNWQVADVGTAALAISVPFSCILGVFASLTASTMGKFYLCEMIYVVA